MSAYIIKNEIDITRQSGDDSEVKFILPIELLSSGTTGATAIFQVFDEYLDIRISKEINSGLTITNNEILIILDAVDTKNMKGDYRYELQMTIDTKITTVAKGNFKLRNELIK